MSASALLVSNQSPIPFRDRPSKPHRLDAALGAAAVYLLVAGAFTHEVWRHLHSGVIAANPHDADLMSWWLGYVPHALAHGHSPLVAPVLNAPTGVSGLWNTSLLLPGVVCAPLTALAGPLASYNLLTCLAPAGSALSGYLVLRLLRTRFAAALAGGALFGFSPALTHQALGHLDLILLPLVPPLLWLVFRIASRPAHPVRLGVVLGAVAAAQLFTSEEVLADTAVTAALIVVTLAASRPRAIRPHAGPAVRGLLTAGTVFIAIVGYPLSVQLTGALAQHGSAFTPDFFKADLTGFVTPSRHLLLHTTRSAAAAATFRGGQPKYSSYLGWPVLLLTLIATTVWWHDLRIRVAAVTGGALSLLSLGATVMVDGRDGTLPAPWAVLRHLPLLGDALPTRLPLFTAAALAVLLATVLERLLTAGLRRLATVVALLTLPPMAPAPLAVAVARPAPAVFSSHDEAVISDGASVLVLPYPTATNTLPMRWQATADYRFAMPGGYFTGPDATGQAYIGGAAPRPTAALLIALDTAAPRPLTYTEGAQARIDLAYWHVTTAAIAECAEHPALIEAMTELTHRAGAVHGTTCSWQLSPEGQRDGGPSLSPTAPKAGSGRASR